MTLTRLSGWWSGTGLLGFRSGQRENIRCRATYRADGAPGVFNQSIRCATASGNVEIKARLVADGEGLSGTWRETKYDLSGALSGHADDAGFRVKVSGSDINASMTVGNRDNRQIVEIQFFDSELIGLSMILARGGG